MDQTVPKRKGVGVFFDDIVPTGGDEEEHLQNLKSRLVLKPYNCQLMKDYIEYLGHVVDKDGIHTSKKKVAAILEMLIPHDQSTLRSYLGMVNHYGRLLKNLSAIAALLHRLLKKEEPWSWDSNCQSSFQRINEVLTTAPCLTHFNPELPLEIACDACSYGISAVLFHVFEDGFEHPIAYASKYLTTAEKNYGQIKRETLSIIFGVKKFHQYLYGRIFQVLTDHKPLVTIFGSKSGIPTMAASRLQRWAIILSAYQYDIKFIPTKSDCNADGLSRLPLGDDPHFNRRRQTMESNVNRIQTKRLDNLPVSAEEALQETAKDPTLQKVITLTLQSWPDIQKELPEAVQRFWGRRNELTVYQGCQHGIRVVIPKKLQPQLLQELHGSHSGVVRMKSMARSYFWWPGIDAKITDVASNCDACQTCAPNPPEHQLPYTIPQRPWSRIHIDFAGPFRNKMWLLVVDAKSKWPEVFPITTTTSEKTFKLLRQLFARLGQPDEIVSDNGPQLTSYQFEAFCKIEGIKHTLTPPHHPQSNGLAERFVRSFKAAMDESKTGGDVDEDLARFLLMYRTTPHATTGQTPSQIMFGRDISNRFSKLHQLPEPTEPDEQIIMRRSFEPNQKVWARKFNSSDNWIAGKISQQLSPTTYTVRMDGQIQKRHIDQLRARSSKSKDPLRSDDQAAILIQQPLPIQQPVVRIQAAPNPGRIRRPVVRCGIDDYVYRRNN